MKDNTFWHKPLTTETAKLYAATRYKGTQTWTSFFNDMKGFSTLSKQLMRWYNNKEADIHFCLNQVIYLGNVFAGESLARICFAFAKPETYPALKSILKTIYRLPMEIPEVGLGEIETSPRANEQLKRILGKS